MKKNIAVIIGRFQGLHQAHLHMIRLALSKNDHLLIVLGSDLNAKSIKNPWTSSERINMIKSCLTKEEFDRVSIIPVKDYLYNNNMWHTSLMTAISSFDINGETIDIDDCSVYLYGHDKDKSTFYLKMFPKFEFIDVGHLADVDATKVRDCFFHQDKLTLSHLVPDPIYNQLCNEMENSEEYKNLHEEFHYILKYKASWSAAPYPVIFTCCDAVVIKSGHVLIVTRKGNPGKGLWALPGGFLDQDETLEDCALRELKEETKINLPKDELKKRIADRKVFDHPNRSNRGRTISHAFLIDLGVGDLPKVKGGDDAAHASWVSFRDIFRNEDRLFEDHFFIIQNMVNKF